MGPPLLAITSILETEHNLSLKTYNKIVDNNFVV